MRSVESSSRSGGYGTRALLFLFGIVVGMLASELVRLPEAHAQIPDAGLQRQQMRRDAIETNRLLNEMLKVLRTETLKVRIIDSDKARGVQTPKPLRK